MDLAASRETLPPCYVDSCYCVRAVCSDRLFIFFRDHNRLQRIPPIWLDRLRFPLALSFNCLLFICVLNSFIYLTEKVKLPKQEIDNG